MCKNISSENKVNDSDGNIYDSVAIGSQIWMTENLRVTKFNNGSSIANVTVGATWVGLTTAAYCWWNNDEATYKNLYGALYNWYTVNTGKLLRQELFHQRPLFIFFYPFIHHFFCQLFINSFNFYRQFI